MLYIAWMVILSDQKNKFRKLPFLNFELWEDPPPPPGPYPQIGRKTRLHVVCMGRSGTSAHTVYALFSHFWYVGSFGNLGDPVVPTLRGVSGDVATACSTPKKGGGRFLTPPTPPTSLKTSKKWVSSGGGLGGGGSGPKTHWGMRLLDLSEYWAYELCDG